MPPKNKKLTKEEKERLKREEEERRAAEEEALRLEKEKEEEERLERERQEREERERLQAIENERFAVESSALDAIIERYEHNLRNLRWHEKSRAKWERYVNCESTPDPTVESELNTYMSLWNDDDDRKTLENQLTQCEEMQHIIRETKKLLQESDFDRTRLSKSSLLLQDMLDDRLDLAALHVLQFAEAHSDGDTQNLSVTAQSKNVTIGIWANTTKNPKIKNFSFEAREFTCDFPKQLVLANVALRLMITRFDHLSPRCVLYRMASPKMTTEEDDETKEETEGGDGRHSQRGDGSGSAAISTSDVAKNTADDEREGSAVSAAKSPSAKSSVAGDPPAQSQAENAEASEQNEGAAQEESVTVEENDVSGANEAAIEKENDNNDDDDDDDERDELLDDENVVDLRQFAPIGGVLHFDLLQLPPQPKTVNNWTMREVIEPRLVKLSYPTGSTPTTNQPILAINMKLPHDVFFPEEPRLARWESSQNCWRTDGIKDALINHDDRSISFKSQYISPLAIITDRYVHLPFQQWELRPMGVSKAKLSITTGANIQLEIEVENGLCWLSMPDDLEEIKGILNKAVSPGELQELMFHAGLNIFPADDGNKYVSVVDKDSTLEFSLYRLMALLLPSVAMSWSRWNAETSKEKIIFRAVECMNAKPIDEGTWNTYMAATRCALLPITEDTEEFESEPKEKTEVHPDIYNVYKASGASAGGLKRINEAKVEFTDCVHHLLMATRLLTFS